MNLERKNYQESHVFVQRLAARINRLLLRRARRVPGGDREQVVALLYAMHVLAIHFETCARAIAGPSPELEVDLDELRACMMATNLDLWRKAVDALQRQNKGAV